jgi:hypothetical protein
MPGKMGSQPPAIDVELAEMVRVFFIPYGIFRNLVI